MKKTVYLFLFISLGISACFKADEEALPINTQSGTLLVLNEGNFQWGNASLSAFDLKSREPIGKDVFHAANKRILGDVLQSALLLNNELWLVINNSGKIEIVNPVDFKSIRTIEGLQSPRYLCKISDNEVALSDLYSGKISFLDIQTGKINHELYLSEWTEQMYLHQNILWVTAPKSEYVYRVDVQSKALIDSIHIGYGSFAIKESISKIIYIATKGKVDENIDSEVHKYDLITDRKLTTFKTFKGEMIRDIATDSKGDLYYISNNVVMRWQDSLLAPITFFSEPTDHFYSLEIMNDFLYVGNAFDFVRNGEVKVYDLNGSFVQNLEAGRIPNGFLILP